MKIQSLHTKKTREVALQLAWEVFLKFEAEAYGPVGTQNFKNLLESAEAKEHLLMYGAYEQDELLGMIAIRLPDHISLFFVSDDHQNQGIGKALFQEYCKRMPRDVITVNSSPYAVVIYEKLRFQKIAEEQHKDGILYTPMQYRKGH